MADFPAFDINNVPFELIDPPAIVTTLEEIDEADSSQSLKPYSFPEGTGHYFVVGHPDSYQSAQSFSDKLSYLHESVGLSNPEEMCMRAMDVKEFLDHPEKYSGISFSFEQASFIKTMSNMRESGAYGRSLFDVVTYPDSDILGCVYSDMSGNVGQWNSWNRIISLDIQAINSQVGIFPVSVVMSYPYEYENPLDEYAVLAVFEEAGHAAETKVIEVEKITYNALYTNIDSLILNASREARTKLSNAVESLNLLFQGKDALFNTILSQNEGEKDMALFLHGKIAEQGRGALSDPEVLYDAFKKFFQNEQSIEDYFRVYLLQDMSWNTSTERIPAEEYIAAFGQTLQDVINGKDTNFLEGRVTSLDDIISLISPESFARQWLEDNRPALSDFEEYPCGMPNGPSEIDGLCP